MEARVVVGAADPTELVLALGALDVGAALHELEHGAALRAIVNLQIIDDEPIFPFSLGTCKLIVLGSLARGAELLVAARAHDMPSRSLSQVEDLLTPLAGAKEQIFVPHHPSIRLELLVLCVTVL